MHCIWLYTFMSTAHSLLMWPDDLVMDCSYIVAPMRVCVHYLSKQSKVLLSFLIFAVKLSLISQQLHSLDIDFDGCTCHWLSLWSTGQTTLHFNTSDSFFVSTKFLISDLRAIICNISNVVQNWHCMSWPKCVWFQLRSPLLHTHSIFMRSQCNV